MADTHKMLSQPWFPEATLPKHLALTPINYFLLLGDPKALTFHSITSQHSPLIPHIPSTCLLGIKAGTTNTHAKTTPPHQSSSSGLPTWANSHRHLPRCSAENQEAILDSHSLSVRTQSLGKSQWCHLQMYPKSEPSHLLPATSRSKPPLSIATLSSLQTQPAAAARAAGMGLFKAQIKSCYSPAHISPMLCTIVTIQCKIHSVACKTLSGLALLTSPASSLPFLLSHSLHLPSFPLTSTRLCYDKQTAY